jgi:hypothetical protein
LFIISRTNGKSFQTALIDDAIMNRIKIGDVVRYKFKKSSPDGRPICPIIYQIRHDMTWKQALANHPSIPEKAGTIFSFLFHFHFFLLICSSDQSKWRKPKQQRMFFDKFAKSRNFNCLDAEKWYIVTRKDIITAVL